MFTADGNGNLNNGFTDTFLLFNTEQGTVNNPQNGAQISAAFDGTYSVDSSGTGRASLSFSNFNPDPKHDYQPVFFFYLTGNGNPPLVLMAGISTIHRWERESRTRKLRLSHSAATTGQASSRSIRPARTTARPR